MFDYWVHKIFAKKKGVYLTSGHKFKKDRKKHMYCGWLEIKEGLVKIFSFGIYSADYSFDYAFDEIEWNEQ
jgi:hypothetical protein